VHTIAFALQAAKPPADAFEVTVALDNELFLPIGQFAERFLGGDPFALAEFHQPSHSAGFGYPRFDGAFAQRFARVRNDKIQIDIDHATETATGLASP
jgi:hypothetical protein